MESHPVLGRLIAVGVLLLGMGAASCSPPATTSPSANSERSTPEVESIRDSHGNWSILGAYSGGADSDRRIDFALFANGLVARRAADGELEFVRISEQDALDMYARACRAAVFLSNTRASVGPDAKYRVLYINIEGEPSRQVSLISWHEFYESDKVVATQDGLISAPRQSVRSHWTVDYAKFREVWAKLAEEMARELKSSPSVAVPLEFEMRR